MSKLNWQVLWALNIKTKDIQGQAELVYDSYKDSLDNILNSIIDDIVASIINKNLCLLKQIILNTKQGIIFNIQMPLGLFYKATSNRDKNSSLFIKKSILPILLSSILPKKLSNPVFRPSGNYDKLRKGKFKAAFIFWALKNSGYIKNQFRS